MRKLFLPIIAILASFLGSCSDEINYTLSNEAIITGFTLGQVKRTMHTTGSDGADSTYTTNYSGSYFPMTIDQLNNKIYNRDSLPYGSHPESILASISAAGSVAYCIAGEAEPEWKIYSSSDSIDFSYLLTFRVMSSDGQAYRDYEMKLNVHQQDGEKFVWQKIADNAPFEDMQQTKAVFWNNHIFVLGDKYGTIYATTWNGNNWDQVSTTGCDAAEVRSLTVLDDKLYLNTKNGKLLTSADGTTWTAVSTEQYITHLIAGGASKLFALSNNEIVYSENDGKTWIKDVLDSPTDWLPTQDLAGIYYSLNNGNQRMMMIGNRAPEIYTQDTTAVIWSKLFLTNSNENLDWMYFPTNSENTYTCPNLSDLSLIYYNNQIIAFGGKPVNGKDQVAYNKLYISKDNGITWKEDDEIVMPFPVRGTTEQVTAAVDSDHFIWLICGSSVWKGRLNELGFNKK